MLLAFDLSLSNTGIAVFNDDGQCKELVSIDTHKESNHSLKLKKIEKVMKKLKKKYHPSMIVIEESFTKYNKSTQAIYKVRGITDLIFWDVEQTCYHATHIRKQVLGYGSVKKEVLRDYIIQNYPEIEFKDLDQSDAYGVGLCYFKEKGIL